MYINKGDFEVPAVCYSFPSHNQINCTTWNEHSEELKERKGDLLCFSIYYNLLSSLAELAGLYGLQTVIMQTAIPFGVWVSSKHRCCLISTSSICPILPYFILVPIYVEFYYIGSSKLSLGIFCKQFPTLHILTLCATLMWAIIIHVCISPKDTTSSESPEKCTTPSNCNKTLARLIDHRRAQDWEEYSPNWTLEYR